jgi:Kef-type K+ transport system membrane component KefB
MGLPEIAGITVLMFALGAQLKLRSFLLVNRVKIAVISAVLVFICLAFLSWAQYEIWRHDPISKFLLPPYQTSEYFFEYALRLFFGPWIISGVFGYISYRLATLLNKKFGERFFEEEEPFLFGLSIFGVGYPMFLFYFVYMALSSLILTGVFTLLKKGRAPLLYLWVPLAICAILSAYLIPRELLVKFNL